MRIVVLGAGLVGRPMALDLAKEKEFEIVVVDQNEDNLKKLTGNENLTTVTGDATNPDFLETITRDCAVCLNALPGFLGFSTLKWLVENGKNVVDIAFAPEDPLQLDEIARQNGVTAIVDCGVAPGMSNLLVGYASSLMKKVEKVRILVGGLPRVRRLPWEYKAVFSPIDVLEEYTRPARFREKGEMVVKPALSDPEFVDFPGLGTLETFNTDGLRTLLKTVDAPDMVEKTLRYPGHRQKIELLKQMGFFSQEVVRVSGQDIRPFDFTAQLLFDQWKLQPGEEDITVMRVEVKNQKETHRFDLYDVYDVKNQVHSMARTTGYTATVMVRAFLKGMIPEKGVIPPEKLGNNHVLVRFVLDELKARNIHYRHEHLT